MKPHWTEDWPMIATRCQAAARLLVVCELEGALAPLCTYPQLPAVPPGTRSVLRRLARCPEVTVAVISRRSAACMQQLLGVEHALLCGNHGLEMHGPMGQWQSPQAGLWRDSIAQVLPQLREGARRCAGAAVEDRHLTAAVCWASHLDSTALELQHALAPALVLERKLTLQWRAGICEVGPQVEWNEGSALRHLLSWLRADSGQAIFLGSGESDPSAFRAYADGVTLATDAPDAAAGYAVRDARDAGAFLFCVLNHRLKMQAAREREQRLGVLNAHGTDLVTDLFARMGARCATY